MIVYCPACHQPSLLLSKIGGQVRCTVCNSEFNCPALSHELSRTLPVLQFVPCTAVLGSARNLAATETFGTDINREVHSSSSDEHIGLDEPDLFIDEEEASINESEPITAEVADVDSDEPEVEVLVDESDAMDEVFEDDQEFDLQPADQPPTDMQAAASMPNVNQATTIRKPNMISLSGLSTPPPRRKQQSGLRSIIGVVLGGFASIPIATAIMWYAMGKDPLGLGPKVAKYVPAIVPERLAGRYGRTMSDFNFGSDTTTGATHFTDDSLNATNGTASAFQSTTPTESSFGTTRPETFNPQSTPETSSTALPERQIDASEVVESTPAAEPTMESPVIETQVAELPFKKDSDVAAWPNDLLIYQQNVLKSFEALDADSSLPTIERFLDDLQMFIQQMNPQESTNRSLQWGTLPETLGRLKSASWLRDLVNESRSRAAKLDLLQNNGLAYIDVFELERVANLDSDLQLQDFAKDFELWLPSERTKEPIRNMKVLGLKVAELPNTPTAKARFVLIGQVIKVDGVDQPIFIVHVQMPL